MNSFSRAIAPFVSAELQSGAQAQANGQHEAAFRFLERAHVLGQSATAQHVRVHWQMLRWGFAQRNFKEVFGQLFRLVGAATKTAFGLVPEGNTGGANISAFKSLPIPDDLAQCIQRARKI
jgi:hypothetical protein